MNVGLGVLRVRLTGPITGEIPLVLFRESTMSNIATFHPNPNEDTEPWIERAALDGFSFRIWHVMFFCFAGFLVLVIFFCCCVKIRIPRTKQEIQANYRRKKLVQKFRERVRLIQNQEMDAIDLERALEIIQDDYRRESLNIAETMQNNPDLNLDCENITNNLTAEPQQPSGFNKIRNALKIGKHRNKNENVR